MWTNGHLRAWESRLAQATWTSRGYMPRGMKIALAVVAIGVAAGLVFLIGVAIGVIATLWGMFG